MSTSLQEFLDHLVPVVDRYDRAQAKEICHELIQHIKTYGPGDPKISRHILQKLRKKRMFDLMEVVGDVMVFAGDTSVDLRCEYAQSLIDQGKLRAAENELERIIRDADAGARYAYERGKPRGLLGRVYKQYYVSAESDAAERLNAAVAQYAAASLIDTDELWYPINIVALAARAERDGVALVPPVDKGGVAREVLRALANRDPETLESFQLATLVEACVALDDLGGALEYLRAYLVKGGTDAFELSSTYRQLVEVWQLTDEHPLGALLPILRVALVTRPGARLDLLPASMRFQASAATEVAFERAFGPDSAKSLAWYRLMLDRARGVGQVTGSVEPDKGLGTGFLIRADEMFPDHAAKFDVDELLFLTNAHVVGSTDRAAVRPRDASIRFEALGPTPVRVGVRGMMWTSPSEGLDATLLRLVPPLMLAPPLRDYALAFEDEPPAFVPEAPSRLFIIGHPLSGPLCISLQDSQQVGWIEPYVHYRTPTDKGNSGSPVFDEQWRIVALHHGSRSNIPHPDGRTSYEANEGTWIHAIRNRAKQEGPAW